MKNWPPPGTQMFAIPDASRIENAKEEVYARKACHCVMGYKKMPQLMVSGERLTSSQPKDFELSWQDAMHTARSKKKDKYVYHLTLGRDRATVVAKTPQTAKGIAFSVDRFGRNWMQSTCTTQSTALNYVLSPQVLSMDPPAELTSQIAENTEEKARMAEGMKNARERAGKALGLANIAFKKAATARVEAEARYAAIKAQQFAYIYGGSKPCVSGQS